LSMTSQPLGPPSTLIEAVRGRKRLRLEIARDLGLGQQGGDTVCVIERLVELENKVRGIAQRDLAGHKSFQEIGAPLKPRQYFGRIGAGERHYECCRVAKILAHSDFGDGDAGLVESRVAAFSFAKDLRQRVPQFFSDA